MFSFMKIIYSQILNHLINNFYLVPESNVFYLDTVIVVSVLINFKRDVPKRLHKINPPNNLSNAKKC